MKYYCWIPGNQGKDCIVEDEDVLTLLGYLLGAPIAENFDWKEAYRLAQTTAAEFGGYFGPYKLCARHKIHDHPNSGCELCQEDKMGGQYIKQRKGRFDDED